MGNETSLADRKQALNNKLASLSSFNVEDASNYKFMNLLRSRLTEEGMPIDVATLIVANLDYDLSAVNEDDDYIGDVALKYAEFVARVYEKLKATNWHRHLTRDVIVRYFAFEKIALEAPPFARQMSLPLDNS